MLDDTKCLLRLMDMQRQNLLTSLNCDGRLGWALLAVLAVPCLLFTGGEHWSEALRYERAALHEGQWWRLVSAHWVHLSLDHMLLDCAGLALLWALYARELQPLGWLAVLIGATVAIDAGLWWGEPKVQWYLGLSGLLHGAWAVGAVAVGRRQGRWAWLMVAVLAIKLLLEQREGSSLLVSEFPVVSMAHVYGALGGLVGYAALALARKPL